MSLKVEAVYHGGEQDVVPALSVKVPAFLEREDLPGEAVLPAAAAAEEARCHLFWCCWFCCWEAVVVCLPYLAVEADPIPEAVPPLPEHPVFMSPSWAGQPDLMAEHLQGPPHHLEAGSLETIQAD